VWTFGSVHLHPFSTGKTLKEKLQDITCSLLGNPSKRFDEDSSLMRRVSFQQTPWAFMIGTRTL